MPVCPSCGFDNQGESNYCSKCGFEIYSATGRISPDTLLEGMGAVYKALDTRLKNTPVAVKEMSTSALGQGNLKEAVEAFEKEASMLIKLRHPALPRVTDYFSQGEDRWYIVMDYIEGNTLESNASKRGPIPETELKDWAQQICGVLDYLHKQKPPVIFRDLKPANIMLTTNNEIKLIDFGIARHFKPETTADTSHYASLGFSPPEQYGQKQTDARSDIYSLGVTMHYLITGLDPSKNPFQFTSPINYGFGSFELSAVIMKAVNVNPDDRFQTVEEMIEQIGSSPLEKRKKVDTKTAVIPNEKLKPMSDRLNKNTEFLTLEPSRNIWSKKTKILAAASIGLVALLFAGYFLGVNYYPVRGIAFEDTKVEVELYSEGVKLNVLFEPSFINERDLTWKSLATDIATVSEDGIIQPKKIGTTIIIANIIQGNHGASCKVTIVKPTLDWHNGTYRGDLKNGVPHGEGTWSNSLGEKYEGDWENGKWHGSGIYTYPNGTVEKSMWLNGAVNTDYNPFVEGIVTHLKFYESGDEWIERPQYTNRFLKNQARFINWRIGIEPHKMIGIKDITLTAIYYNPNGSILTTQEISETLFYDKYEYGWDDKIIKVGIGWGWHTPGNWNRGRYKVEIYLKNQLISSGYFEIY